MTPNITNHPVGTTTSTYGFAGTVRCGTDWSELPAEHEVERWYAAYTRANHEKRVTEQMVQREVQYFLATYPSVRRWKDRRKTLELPLFPGYVFVRICLRDRLKILQIPGVARLVGFEGKPVALPEAEIEALRFGLERGMRAEPRPFLTVGRRVRVKSGPLTGMEGILTQRKRNYRVILSIHLIQKSVAVEVDLADVECA